MDLPLDGVYVPVLTPFDAFGDLDLDALAAVVEHVLSAGVRGIVACGTTGEYYALTDAERIAVMRTVHTAAAGRALLVAGCNAGATRQSVALATVARDLGYDGLMLAAPATSLPQQHELAAHFVAVAESADLPTILYNYPARAGVEIGLECLDRVAGHPLVVGLKESSGDFSRLLTVLRRYPGELTVMCGSDDQAADYFFWGVRGWIAGTANVLPRQHVEILEAANSGDHDRARSLFARLLPWLQHMEAGAYNQKAKLGLRHLGLDCGEVRSPLLPLGDEAAAALVEVLDAAAALMQPSTSATAVEVHAEGEQGTCYLASPFDVPGRTVADKLHHLNCVDDTVRRLLTHEPRGRPQASANLVFPPSDPRADAAFVVLQADRAHAMSGSNTICVVTALLETGTLAMTEPTTVVTLETAAGLVRAEASCRDGRCQRVTFTGVPSFVEALAVPLEVPGVGSITVDVAYGGCFYVLVDAAALGVRLTPEGARDVVERAELVMAAARPRITVCHPEIPEIDFLSYVMVTGEDDPAAGRLRGATVLSGRVDRSPCGTGTSARLACLAARGLAGRGSRFVATSVIESEFAVAVKGTASVGGRPAVVPSISGRGWIFGTRTATVDPTDPYPTGFTLSDLWGRRPAG